MTDCKYAIITKASNNTVKILFIIMRRFIEANPPTTDLLESIPRTVFSALVYFLVYIVKINNTIAISIAVHK